MIIDLEVAFTSLPSHADKKALVAPALRAPGLVRWARENDHNIVGISELATIGRIFIRLALGWGCVDAKSNNIFGMNRIGNSLMYRKWLYKVVRSKSIPVSMPGHQFGEINMLAVLLDDRQTGERFWVIVWHAPRKKTDPRTNIAVRRAVILAAKDLQERTGHPVIPVGDSNDRRAIKVFIRCGFDIGAEEEVTMIASIGDVRWKQSGHDKVRWSDHVALWADGRTGRVA